MENNAKVPELSSRLFWVTILGMAGVWLLFNPSTTLGDRTLHYAVIAIVCIIAVFQIISSITRIRGSIGSRVSMTVDYVLIAASLAYLTAILIRLL